MRTIETPGGIPTFISVLECKLYDRIVTETCKDDMSERDAYTAQKLAEKNILKRIVKDGKTYFMRNTGSL